MTLSEELQWRGLVKDKTFQETSWLDEPKSFYLGIDASADSLTVGNLAIVLLARRLTDAGWSAYLVMGGGTSLVGDPGGKTEERQLMSRDIVQQNIAGVKQQVTNLFSGEKYTLKDNYDWLSELKYVDFLRDVGKHFAMTELMQRDFVTERMGDGGAGISYAEFSYSLVQGYDFWHLFKDHGVLMQIGGSDQWGNMLSGVALIRKKEGQEAQALSMPLIINKATGVKFGKSEGGAVWLDQKKTTPTQFYQFWINTDDADVEDYLKVFTLLSKEEIDNILSEHGSDVSKRHAQKKLAEEVTKLVHGEEGNVAVGVTKYLTGETSLAGADESELAQIRQEIRAAHIQRDMSIIETLAQTGLASSNGDARRLLQGGAIYINGQSIDREGFEDGDFQNGRLLLRRGKAFKDSALIELEQ